jgi:hypothetical protein
MRYVAASTLIILVTAACSGSGPGAVSPPKALMYEMPGTPTLTYVSEGAQDVTVDAGAMGTIDITGSSEMTVAMTFEPAAEGMQVTVEFQKLSATLSNPMAGTQTASESDIDGNLVFTMDELGNGTLVSAPTVRGAAEQLVRPAGIVYEFFPNLPGTEVNPGDTWTDTTSYGLPSDAGTIELESITHYSMVGDTMVDGVTLMKIDFATETESLAEVQQQGMDVIQTSTGEVTGFYLFDAAQGIMVFAETSLDMEGSTEVPAAGIPPMPMTITGTGTVRLQGG